MLLSEPIVILSLRLAAWDVVHMFFSFIVLFKSFCLLSYPLHSDRCLLVLAYLRTFNLCLFSLLLFVNFLVTDHDLVFVLSRIHIGWLSVTSFAKFVLNNRERCSRCHLHKSCEL